MQILEFVQSSSLWNFHNSSFKDSKSECHFNNGTPSLLSNSLFRSSRSWASMKCFTPTNFFFSVSILLA